MKQVTIELSDAQVAVLQQLAAHRRVPVNAIFLDYVEYLSQGGEPLDAETTGTLDAVDLALVNQHGGAFDWLADEPDLYSLDDGEPV